MCYSRCPGENWEGECVRPSIQGRPGSFCYDGDDNQEKEEEDAESQ